MINFTFAEEQLQPLFWKNLQWNKYLIRSSAENYFPAWSSKQHAKCLEEHQKISKETIIIQFENFEHKTLLIWAITFSYYSQNSKLRVHRNILEKKVSGRSLRVIQFYRTLKCRNLDMEEKSGSWAKKFFRTVKTAFLRVQTNTFVTKLFWIFHPSEISPECDRNVFKLWTTCFQHGCQNYILHVQKDLLDDFFFDR